MPVSISSKTDKLYRFDNSQSRLLTEFKSFRNVEDANFFQNQKFWLSKKWSVMIRRFGQIPGEWICNVANLFICCEVVLFWNSRFSSWNLNSFITTIRSSRFSVNSNLLELKTFSLKFLYLANILQWALFGQLWFKVHAFHVQNNFMNIIKLASLISLFPSALGIMYK